jgi:hypothetical protein
MWHWIINHFRAKVHVSAFGWTFDRGWGAATHTTKLVELAGTILTIGVGFWLYW